MSIKRHDATCPNGGTELTSSNTETAIKVVGDSPSSSVLVQGSRKCAIQGKDGHKGEGPEGHPLNVLVPVGPGDGRQRLFSGESLIKEKNKVMSVMKQKAEPARSGPGSR